MCLTIKIFFLVKLILRLQFKGTIWENRYCSQKFVRSPFLPPSPLLFSIPLLPFLLSFLPSFSPSFLPVSLFHTTFFLFTSLTPSPLPIFLPSSMISQICKYHDSICYLLQNIILSLCILYSFPHWNKKNESIS